LDASDEDIGTSKLTKGKKAFKSRESLDFIDDDEDDVGTSKAKGKSKGRPSISHAVSSNTSTGGLGILTAAEQRMQTQKQTKKDTESPFEFLQDVKDVRFLLPSSSSSSNIWYRKTRIALVTKVMILGPFSYQRMPGSSLQRSKLRSVIFFNIISFTDFFFQFWEIKQNHYDTVCLTLQLPHYSDSDSIGQQILFFQKGKFYELYEDDARIGHQVFDLK
jgi:DNA mismatch repair protein MSH6